MSKSDSTKPSISFLTKWRLYSCLFGLIFGSWMGASILVFLKTLPQAGWDVTKLLAALVGSFGLGLLGIPVAFPVAALAILFGIPFWWDDRISLFKVLGITLCAVGMLLIAELLGKGGSTIHAFQILTSALLSAALCWRITLRWHSPVFPSEAPSPTPLQP